MCEKVGKSRNIVFFFVWGSGGSKSRLAKAAGAEPKCTKHTMVGPLLEVEMSKKRKHISKSKCTKHLSVGPLLEVEMSKKCTPWREAHFEVKMYKAPQRRTAFGSWDVEKVHAVVARSTCRSQNVQNTSVSDDFWKLRCRKSARPCGAKHSSKSKCTKRHMFAPVLEVRMLEKCTPLWCEAHFQVKMYKRPHVRATFGGSDVPSLRFTTLHYTTLPSTTLHYNYNYNYTTTLHYTPLHSTTLHYTTLHYTTYTPLHYITLHSTTLHYTRLHYLPLHFTTLLYSTLHSTTTTQLHNYTATQLHSTTPHYTKLHYITLHSTTLHSTTLHYTTLHYLPLHSTTLNYATLDYTTLRYTTLHSMTLDHR